MILLKSVKYFLICIYGMAYVCVNKTQYNVELIFVITVLVKKSIYSFRLPMATSATDQMKEFWEKNQKLKRPSSPWTIYQYVDSYLLYYFTRLLLSPPLEFVGVYVLCSVLPQTFHTCSLPLWHGPSQL